MYMKENHGLDEISHQKEWICCEWLVIVSCKLQR